MNPRFFKATNHLLSEAIISKLSNLSSDLYEQMVGLLSVDDKAITEIINPFLAKNVVTLDDIIAVIKKFKKYVKSSASAENKETFKNIHNNILLPLHNEIEKILKGVAYSSPSELTSSCPAEVSSSFPLLRLGNDILGNIFSFILKEVMSSSYLTICKDLTERLMTLPLPKPYIFNKNLGGLYRMGYFDEKGEKKNHTLASGQPHQIISPSQRAVIYNQIVVAKKPFLEERLPYILKEKNYESPAFYSLMIITGLALAPFAYYLIEPAILFFQDPLHFNATAFREDHPRSQAEKDYVMDLFPILLWGAILTSLIAYGGFYCARKQKINSIEKNDEECGFRVLGKNEEEANPNMIIKKHQ